MRDLTAERVRARLQRELDARKGNMRQLARDIAGETGNVETVRRALYRVLTEGRPPKPETSEIFERGLGRRHGYFTVNQGRPPRQDPLERLAKEVADLWAALDIAGRAHDELLARVEALEPAQPAKRAAAAARPRARKRA